jgi:O-antigen ligase
MALWLLWTANSATAFAIFFLAGTVMVLASRPALGRRPAFIHLLVVAMLSVVVSALFLNTGTSMVESLGRDSTLTGRTDMWRMILALVDNPWLGAGFESFWIGGRLEKMARIYATDPNQAHNGYIEVYVNLGWVGVAVLAGVLVTGYRHAVAAVRRQVETGSLSLAYVVAIAISNCTEAGFKMMSPIWIVFLLATIVTPGQPALAVRRNSRASEAVPASRKRDER